MSTRRSPLLGPVLLVLATGGVIASGCDTEAYCFICDNEIDDAGSGGGGGDGEGGSGGDGIITGGTGGTGGGSGGNGGLGGQGGEAGDTSCPGKDTKNDPLNCGKCGHVCQLHGAFSDCENGECVIKECAPNFKDLNGIDADGCEYACPVRPQTDEECNSKDDDCDGKIDEGITLDTVDNCGFCGNVCSVPHATPRCGKPTGSNDFKCLVDECDEGWFDKDGIPEDGCEYQCPVFPLEDEQCDGIDQDCDSKVDEDAPGTGEDCDEICPNGQCIGECTPGTTICLGTGAIVCIVGDDTVGPSLEICDNKDNDCNGQVDDGFDFDTDAANCGGCGNICTDTLPHAISKCEGGQCVFDECEPGYRDLNPNLPGCEYQCPVFPPLTTEICNNLDDDCDGQRDEDLVTPSPDEFCRVTPGSPCEGVTPVCCNDFTSEPVCVGHTGQWRCTYPPGVETDADGTILTNETRCDNFDNNCDGNIDEPWPNLHASCTAGEGACSTIGSYECVINNPTADPACTAVLTPEDARDESCNGVDDNCDGQADERVPTGTLTCYDGPGGQNPHTCQGWIDPMVNIGSGVYMYKYEAAHPDATSAQVGVNELRACSNPNVLPWTSVTNAAAALACSAVKDSTGAGMRLCTEAEWMRGCEATVTPNPSLWSYTSSPGTYVAARCNDANSGRNPLSPWPTATNAACASRWSGSNDIFDLSGNVAEWTSTLVQQSGKNYYRVRGGNYLSLQGATTCEFNFVLQRDTFRNFDLGFRCCSNNAP